MDDELLVKFLLQEATEAEQRQVMEWIHQSPANEKYFGHFELIWQSSKSLADVSKVDEDAAWARFQQRITRNSKPALIVPIKKNRTWLRVAAAVVVMVALISLYRFIDNHFPGGKIADPVNLATLDNTSKDTLPDQSVITLNRRSSLMYDERSSGGKTRHASLKGEAFFNVAPDKTRPFVVDVDGIEIKVVGTSFNIKELADRTEIIVESGVVSVNKGSDQVVLVKGESLIVPSAGKLPSKQATPDRLYNYYRSKQFVCDNTPLWKLVEVLNEAYGTQIVIRKKEARNYPLSTTFNEEPIENILSIISETFNLTVTRKGDTFFID